MFARTIRLNHENITAIIPNRNFVQA